MAVSFSPLLSSGSHFWGHLSQRATYDDFAALGAGGLAAALYLTKGRLWSRPDPYQYKLFEKPQQQTSTASVNKRSRQLADRMHEENADIAVLWGSQSGTAERLAARLAKELTKSLGAGVLLLDISDIESNSCASIPSSKLVVFMVSTFGEGDPSDNMHDFWAWLQQLREGSLQDFRFLAFGLGNSNYKHYNQVVKVLYGRLNSAGAHAPLPVGMADDAKGETEEHYLEWKEQVLEIVQTRFGYNRCSIGYECSLEVVHDDSLEPIDLHHGTPALQPSGRTSALQSNVFALPIVQKRELFQDSEDRHCLHLELDLNDRPDLKYKTGDHLGVWPVNPVSELERLVKVLGQESMRAVPCHIKSLDGTPVKIPTPTTLNAAFGHYLEICAPVSREHIRVLSHFAPTPTAKEFLLNISRSRDTYADYLSKNYTTLGRLLERACGVPGAWNQLPLPVVLESLPAMQPRYYSISSSSVVQARRAAMTVVVDDRVIAHSGERIAGVATNYLLSSAPGLGLDIATQASHQSHSASLTHQPLQPGFLHAFVRRSTFKLPIAPSTPILMVGAGTGIAPLRAFVQERARLCAMGREIGRTKLFFGCRHPNQDFLYQEELAELGEKLGDSFSLTTAFSRPNDVLQKCYVQDEMIREAGQVCDLLVDGNAYFYICGSAAMARDVSEAVAQILETGRGWTESQVSDFTDRQRRQKRWLQDVWG